MPASPIALQLRRSLIRAGSILVALVVGGGSVEAQSPRDEPRPRDGRIEAEAAPGVEELARSLREAQAAHLRRLAWWGGANLLGGVALATTADEGSGWRGFGVQSAGWGAVNLGIAAFGLLREPDPLPDTGRELLEDEDGYGHLLLVNMGLNVGYALVGGTLLVAAGEGLNAADEVRGHGSAVLIQGLGLLALDAFAWVGSRERLRTLRDAVPLSVGPGPSPGAASVTLLSVGVGP